MQYWRKTGHVVSKIRKVSGVEKISIQAAEDPSFP